MRTSLARLGAAAAAATAAATCLAGPASAATEPLGTTSVVLNRTTVATIEHLGITPAPVAPGTLGGKPLTATFPIVRTNFGEIFHRGGLSLTAGSHTLTLVNYVINGFSGKLTAAAALDGSSLGRITLFDLAGAPNRPGCASTDRLDIDRQASAALTKVFQTPSLTGVHFGVACIRYSH